MWLEAESTKNNPFFETGDNGSLQFGGLVGILTLVRGEKLSTRICVDGRQPRKQAIEKTNPIKPAGRTESSWWVWRLQQLGKAWKNLHCR